MAKRQFSIEEARRIGETIGIDWTAGTVDLEQFRVGLSIELEHGAGIRRRTSPTTTRWRRARSLSPT
jgi:hypothetical protein